MPRHEERPRSEAQADLGGGMNTYYREGYLPSPSPQVPESEQQARKTRQPILEPSADDLAQLSDREKKEIAANFRKIRQAHIAGTLGELTFSEAEPVEVLESVEPEQLEIFPENLDQDRG